VVSTPYSAGPQTPPPTAYGDSQPYQATLPPSTPYDPYNPYNPYNPPTPYPYTPYPAAPLTPVPVPPQRRGNRIGIIIGVAALVLLIAGGGIFTLLRPASRNSPAIATPTVNVTATAHANTTATATAGVKDPYTHSGTLLFVDPLSDNSKGYGWSEDAPNCVFTGGAYHVIAPDARYSDYCLAQATNFNDFAFEAQMQIIKGDAGGLDFRFTSTTNNEYYEFYIGQDGSYDLYLVTGTSSSGIKALTSGSNPAIKQGLNQTNLIAVVAQGHSIMLYVNHQLIDKVTDSTYTSGRIGFDADTLATNGHPTEVVFSNAKVWTL